MGKEMRNEENTPRTVRCRNPRNGVVCGYTYQVFYEKAQGKSRQRRQGGSGTQQVAWLRASKERLDQAVEKKKKKSGHIMEFKIA